MSRAVVIPERASAPRACPELVEGDLACGADHSQVKELPASSRAGFSPEGLP